MNIQYIIKLPVKYKDQELIDEYFSHDFHRERNLVWDKQNDRHGQGNTTVFLELEGTDMPIITSIQF